MCISDWGGTEQDRRQAGAGSDAKLNKEHRLVEQDAFGAKGHDDLGERIDDLRGRIRFAAVRVREGNLRAENAQASLREDLRLGEIARGERDPQSGGLSPEWVRVEERAARKPLDSHGVGIGQSVGGLNHRLVLSGEQ